VAVHPPQELSSLLEGSSPDVLTTYRVDGEPALTRHGADEARRSSGLPSCSGRCLGVQDLVLVEAGDVIADQVGTQRNGFR